MQMVWNKKYPLVFLLFLLMRASNFNLKLYSVLLSTFISKLESVFNNVKVCNFAIVEVNQMTRTIKMQIKALQKFHVRT